jgi:hypothetical protein
MSPAENWSRKVSEFSQYSFEVTHKAFHSVALECAVVDIHIGSTVISNSSPLEVACPPPGHGRNIRKILETIIPPLTW